MVAVCIDGSLEVGLNTELPHTVYVRNPLFVMGAHAVTTPPLHLVKRQKKLYSIKNKKITRCSMNGGGAKQASPCDQYAVGQSLA